MGQVRPELAELQQLVAEDVLHHAREHLTLVRNDTLTDRLALPVENGLLDTARVSAAELWTLHASVAGRPGWHFVYCGRMAAPRDRCDSEQCTRAEQLRTWALIPLILLLAGCAGTATRPDPGSAGDATSAAIAETPAPPQATPPRPTSIWPALRDGFALPAQAHPRIDRELRRLTRSPHAVEQLLARGRPYLPLILAATEAAGLPAEIALLPAVESGFDPLAHSPNGAAGLWQFMPATGHMLGLERDWWYDGRRAVVPSTEAAIVYLKRLHKRFDGDWLHALAAYNAGAGTVGRAIRRAAAAGRPTDYWSLDLPGETDAYVPRLFALARVIEDPAAFGVRLPAIPPTDNLVVVQTGGQIDLKVAADLSGLTVDELLRLNPGHRRWATHPDGPHQLLLPASHVVPFEQGLAALPEAQRLRWRQHRIVPGDSLIRIARRYGVTVDAIKVANGLSDSRIRAGRDLRIPLSDAVDGDATRLASNNRARQRLRYRVRQGDSLYAIARRFNVSIGDLQRWNQVGRYLQPGDRLTVYVDPDA
jgi:membrane-bound lytic murein transglycosylase D